MLFYPLHASGDGDQIQLAEGREAHRSRRVRVPHPIPTGGWLRNPAPVDNDIMYPYETLGPEQDWLVVGNISYFSINWECHHSN